MAQLSNLFRSLTLLLPLALPIALSAAEHVKPGTVITSAGTTPEAEAALKRFKIPSGFKSSVYASEPHVQNPVAFAFDHQGRLYIVEANRHTDGVLDIRGYMSWLDDDLAARTVEDRTAMIRKHMGKEAESLTNQSDRIRLLLDTNKDGRVDSSTVFADGFNGIPDGLGAGVLAVGEDVYFTNIPELWHLKDTDGDGHADVKKSLHHGYGVHMGFLGHDLHGLRMGPDGKLYYSIGDRGAHIRTDDGRVVSSPDAGAVFRCNPDGTELELFATGLRNPQELTFDAFGNLFTGDNNSDAGDKARWVYVVEGGDSGWRIHYQFIEAPVARGPWNAEKLWHPYWAGQAAYIIPPIDHIANGPSGLTFNPGTGMPAKYQDHFFLCDFRGSPSSTVYSFALKPKGASFEIFDKSEFVTGFPCTDVDFGIDGGLYVLDWVEGWSKTGKGRLYRIYDEKAVAQPEVTETKTLLTGGLKKKSVPELVKYLFHSDQRVRQNAQFEIVTRGESGTKALVKVAKDTKFATLPRIHAIWGLGQIQRSDSARNKDKKVLEPLVALVKDADAEVRAQATRVLGDARYASSYFSILKGLKDASPRVRFYSAMALGKLGKSEAIPALFAFLAGVDASDPYERHAGVMGLTWIGNAQALKPYQSHNSSRVRMGALLALRRLASPEVQTFLTDSDPLIISEAARAIYDLPIPAALSALGGLTDQANVPEVALKRAVAAHLRLGTADSASALARVVASRSAPESSRIESLDALANWQQPPPRDRVLGHWAPLGKRDGAAVAKLVEGLIPAVLTEGSDALQRPAVRAISAYHLTSQDLALDKLVRSSNRPTALRVEALTTLASLKSPRLADLLEVATKDSREEVRKEATRLQTQLEGAGSIGRLERSLSTGTAGDRQAAYTALGTLDSPEAISVLEKSMEALIAGKVAPEAQLELIEAVEKRNTPGLKTQLEKYRSAGPAKDPIAGFRESLQGGNYEEGRKVFHERAEASCLRCHQVNGEGGEVGPSLTGVGTKQTREYLLESILYPNNKIAEGYDSVLVRTKDGQLYAGIIKSESATELVLNSPEDGIVKVAKNQIESRDKGLSAMPGEISNVLSKRDLRNLIEYLAQQK